MISEYSREKPCYCVLRLCKTITYLFSIPSKTHLRRREGVEKHLHRTTDVVVPAWKPGSRSQDVKVSLSCALDPGFLPGRRSVDYARIFLHPPACKSEPQLGAKKISYCFTEPNYVVELQSLLNQSPIVAIT